MTIKQDGLLKAWGNEDDRKQAMIVLLSTEVLNTSNSSAFKSPVEAKMLMEDVLINHPKITIMEFIDIMNRGRRMDIPYNDKIIMVNAQVIHAWVDKVKMDYLFGWRQKYGDEIIDYAIKQYDEMTIALRARYLNRSRSDEHTEDVTKLFDYEEHTPEYENMRHVLQSSQIQVNKSIIKRSDLWENL